MSKPDFIKQKPDIRLIGEVDDKTAENFLEQLDKALKKDGPYILEMTTIGGDAEIGRRIASEVQHCHEQGKELYFLGKTSVYSAGITVMGAFPQGYRYITKDTVLLIHERRMEKEISFKDKPMQACAIIVEQLKSQLEMAQTFQTEGFERLAKGSKISAAEIEKRARNNWYVRAEEALELGLVADLV